MKKTIFLSTALAFTTIGISQSIKPFVIGEIHEIESRVLNEKRTLNIFLPAEYHADDTSRYEVIYLLDGSADEDFIHVSGLVQFNTFPWINRIPKSIVVGIANVDRQRDFTYPTSIPQDFVSYPTTGGSQRFIMFIAAELQPYIEEHFRTAGHKTIIGQSLGGLLATEILLKHPDLFDQYILVSPSLWWDDGSLLDQTTYLLHEKESATNVYVAVGKEGPGPGALPHIMEEDVRKLVDKLETIEDPKFKLHFDYLPEEDHATILHQALLNAFKIISLQHR